MGNVTPVNPNGVTIREPDKKKSNTLYNLFLFIFYIVVYITFALLIMVPILILLCESPQILNGSTTYVDGIFLIIACILMSLSTIVFLHYVRIGLFYPAIYPSDKMEPMTIIFILSMIYIIGLFIIACDMWYNWNTSNKCSDVSLSPVLPLQQQQLLNADLTGYNKERIISMCGTTLFVGFLALVIGIFFSGYVLNKKRDIIVRDIIEIFKRDPDNCRTGNCKLPQSMFGSDKFGAQFREFLETVSI